MRPIISVLVLSLLVLPCYYSHFLLWQYAIRDNNNKPVLNINFSKALKDIYSKYWRSNNDIQQKYCNFRCFESLGHQCFKGFCYAPTDIPCVNATCKLPTVCLANDNVTESCYLNVHI